MTLNQCSCVWQPRRVTEGDIRYCKVDEKETFRCTVRNRIYVASSRTEQIWSIFFLTSVTAIWLQQSAQITSDCSSCSSVPQPREQYGKIMSQRASLHFFPHSPKRRQYTNGEGLISRLYIHTKWPWSCSGNHCQKASHGDLNSFSLI